MVYIDAPVNTQRPRTPRHNKTIKFSFVCLTQARQLSFIILAGVYTQKKLNFVTDIKDGCS